MKDTFRLTRLASIGDSTIGILEDTDGGFSCCTIEREWKNNEPFLSRVPAGVYSVFKHRSPKNGDVFMFDNEDTAPRTYIQIHVANKASELAGCVGVGSSFGILDGNVAVLGSRKAMNLLYDKYDKFMLHVVDPKGG